MIAVMIIILMMMGAIAPLLDIGGAAGVDSSARVVASQMRMARSYAIAQKKYVAVLMPTADTGDKGGADEMEYRASTIRACILDGAPTFNATTKNREGTFDEYLPGSSWTFLPKGTYIGYTETNGPYGTAATDCRCNTVSGLPFPSGTSLTQYDNVRAIIFTPTGSTTPAAQGGSPGTTDTIVRVVEAVHTDTELNEKNYGKNALEFLVYNLTGRVSFTAL
jgi:hypothetical protein